MRAIIAEPNSSLGLSLAEVPEPQVGPGELCVRVEAASVNRGEIRNARSQPPGTVIGWDFAGTVEAVGAEVQAFQVGQRVVGLAPNGGSYAEFVKASPDWTVPLESGCPVDAAATLPVAGITAASVLSLTEVARGQRLLVTGAAGGVGNLLVQMASRRGVEVTGQVRTRGQMALAAGAKSLLVHEGQGAPIEDTFDAIADGIGGPMLVPLLRALVFRGTLVVYGNSADTESRLRIEDLYARAARVLGFRVFASLTPKQAMDELRGLMREVAAEHLHVEVNARVSLPNALEAIESLYRRERVGKLVLVPKSR
jgi:NADPH:quinone reductase